MIRRFSKFAVGVHEGKEFELIKIHTSQNFIFPWTYVEYECEQCNHKKTVVIQHKIHTVEVYRLLEDIKSNNPRPYDFYRLLAVDGKSLGVPRERMHEVMFNIKQ